MSDDAVILHSDEHNTIFSFPHLDKMLKENAHASHDRVGAAMHAAIAGGVNPPPPASTSGWDTVFSIRAKDVNSAIKKQKTSPTTFNQDQPFGPNSSLSGNFSDWSVTTGADGENMNVLIPVTSGAFVFQGVSYDMTGAEATGTYHLNVIPANPPATKPTKTSSTKHSIVVSDKKPNVHVPIVSVVLFTVPTTTSSKWDTSSLTVSAITSLMSSAVSTFLNANVKDFTQTFAAVDLNILADHGTLQWLSPAFTSYAFADGGTVDNSFFGVLTLTSDIGRASNLKHTLANAAIPSNQRSAFLISQQLFMREAVFPGLPHAFKTAAASDFKLTNNDTEVINATTDKVELDAVKYGAIDYHPFMNSFDLVINTTELHTTMTVKVQISPGIVTYIDINTWHGLTLEKKTNGKQTIGYNEVRPYKATHRVHTSPGVIITEVIASIIVAVVGLVVGKIADTLAKRIIVAIIVAIIAGIITAIQLIITEVIAKGVAEGMPDIDPLIQTGTDPITWPTQQSQFTITAAQLNEAIQLSGDPGFA